MNKLSCNLKTKHLENAPNIREKIVDKVILINPINKNLQFIVKNGVLYENASIGLLIVESKLKQYEINTEIIDLNILCSSKKFQEQIEKKMWFDAISEEIIQRNACYVGFTTMASTYVQIIIIANKLKTLNNDIVIFLGGPQSTLTAKKTIEKFECIDFICCGEFESQAIYMKDFFEHKIKIEEIPNIIYRDKNGLIKKTYTSELIDLDSSDFMPLNFDIYKSKNESNLPKSYIAIEGGRGCPFSCTFCSTKIYWKQSFRLKNINSLINEINQINKIYSPKKINILHDLFTVNKNLTKEFCKSIKKLDIKWMCSSRVDTLDNDILDCMKESGCVDIFFGIESGDKNVLKKINKNINPEKAKQIIKYCSNIGIQSSISFIVGFPFETLSEIENSLQLLSKLIILPNVKFSIAHLIPLPGTEISLQYKNKLKFYPEIYFDSREIEKINPELEIKYIKEYPELFSFFYFIEGENFNFYYICTFINIFEFLACYFKNTLYLLLKEIGGIKFINRIISDINIPFIRKKKYDFFTDTNNIYKKFVKIVYSDFGKRKDSIIFNLFCYENDLYRFGFGSKRGFKEIKIAKKYYDYNIAKIILGIRNWQDLSPSECEEKFSICFSKINNRLQINMNA